MKPSPDSISAAQNRVTGLTIRAPLAGKTSARPSAVPSGLLGPLCVVVALASCGGVAIEAILNRFAVRRAGRGLRVRGRAIGAPLPAPRLLASALRGPGHRLPGAAVVPGPLPRLIPFIHVSVAAGIHIARRERPTKP